MWRVRHNTRACVGLENRAGRGERTRQRRQEQEDWEVSDDKVDIDGDSEPSQLLSSDFEGLEL